MLLLVSRIHNCKHDGVSCKFSLQKSIIWYHSAALNYKTRILQIRWIDIKAVHKNRKIKSQSLLNLIWRIYFLSSCDWIYIKIIWKGLDKFSSTWIIVNPNCQLHDLVVPAQYSRDKQFLFGIFCFVYLFLHKNSNEALWFKKHLISKSKKYPWLFYLN